MWSAVAKASAPSFEVDDTRQEFPPACLLLQEPLAQRAVGEVDAGGHVAGHPSFLQPDPGGLVPLVGIEPRLEGSGPALGHAARGHFDYLFDRDFRPVVIQLLQHACPRHS
ncbi:hypothetical protein ASG25_09660 [Rhizobium sp. Leaf384]|nr:hypothetical protein ASG25_09660 [Rhizobium sp. Leaf384]KQS85494.1 hypothetical protein ASG58_18905 [Rhizobium sp. Leaf383]